MRKPSLSFQFTFLVLLLHIALGVLLYLVLIEYKIWFLVSEFFIFFSLFLFFSFYQKLLRPLQFIGDGINALKDRDFHVKYLPIGSPDLDPLIITFNEMIDALRAERIQAQEQHFFLDKLIKASPVGILILDYDGGVSQYNPRIATIFGEEFLNNTTGKVGQEQDEQSAFLLEMQNVEVGTTKFIEFKNIKYRCEITHFLDRGFKRKFVLIQDLSKEFLQTEKKAYGQVIRMMAHEVNNSIGAINSILDSLLKETEEEGRQVNFTEMADYLKLAMERNLGLNQFMKNFASVVRIPAPMKEPTNICAVLKATVQVLRSGNRDKAIDFEFQFEKEEIVISCDRRQMEQAFLNIIKNAMEAIRDVQTNEHSGKVKIAVDQEQIVIMDNGKGITSAEQVDIFTPFWSSKPTGQGIGLMLVREIFNNHDWQYSLKTDTDGWTRFSIAY